MKCGLYAVLCLFLCLNYVQSEEEESEEWKRLSDKERAMLTGSQRELSRSRTDRLDDSFISKLESRYAQEDEEEAEEDANMVKQKLLFFFVALFLLV
jgi:hypothetical protein